MIYYFELPLVQVANTTGPLETTNFSYNVTELFNIVEKESDRTHCKRNELYHSLIKHKL